MAASGLTATRPIQHFAPLTARVEGERDGLLAGQGGPSTVIADSKGAIRAGHVRTGFPAPPNGDGGGFNKGDDDD